MKADQSTAKLVVAGQGRSVAIELTAEGASSVMADTHEQQHCKAASSEALGSPLAGAFIEKAGGACAGS